MTWTQRGSEQVQGARGIDSVTSGGHPEFAIDGLLVGLDRVDGDEQIGRYFS
jgi:hypothetical protein